MTAPYLVALNTPNIEVWRHDIGADQLPERAFDLIHERLVLIHVPHQEAAIQRIAAALKPGGWMAAEDFDPRLLVTRAPPMNSRDAALYSKMEQALGQVMTGRGADRTTGTKLCDYLRHCGLIDVELEGYLLYWPWGSAGALLDRANFTPVREEAVQRGFITDKEFDGVLRLLEDPSVVTCSPILMTA